ncbi:hypothetical protein [Anaerophilus nitritogenes]|uniref:hypothetical protein n=1 Tax=Anaerophilus nitritogenes TaxID=2498136 RepID=UPI0013ED4FA3|nr:hypothetical protein [Anaerophilus nitritogenes]
MITKKFPFLNLLNPGENFSVITGNRKADEIYKDIFIDKCARNKSQLQRILLKELMK